MSDFIIIVEETNIIEFLDVSLEEIVGKVLDVLKDLASQLLDGFMDIFIFLSDIGLEKESFHGRLQTTN